MCASSSRFAKTVTRFFCSFLCFALVFTSTPITLPVRVSSAQSSNSVVNNAAVVEELKRIGLRGLNPPTEEPDLERDRYKEWKEPKLPDGIPATKCRHHDEKCKTEKERDRSWLNNPNPEQQIARLESVDKLFDWRGNIFPLQLSNSLAYKPQPPIADLPVSKRRPKPLDLRAASAPAALQTGLINARMTERVEPKYRTGGAGIDLFSGNYNWSVPISVCPGAADSI